MRISKSGKLTVSPTCESASPGSRCFQKNLDSAVNPARRPIFDSFLSHSFLLPQRNCASVGTAPCARRLQQEVADRKPGGCERPRGHNPRAVVTGFKIYMRCAREGLCHLAVNGHHKWLFIEELRRSLARSLASNAVVASFGALLSGKGGREN